MERLLGWRTGQFIRMATIVLFASVAAVVAISLVGNCSQAVWPDRFPPDESIRCRDQEREVIDYAFASWSYPPDEGILVQALGTHSGDKYKFLVFPNSRDRVVARIGEDCSILSMEESWSPLGIPGRAEVWKED